MLAGAICGLIGFIGVFVIVKGLLMMKKKFGINHELLDCLSETQEEITFYKTKLREAEQRFSKLQCLEDYNPATNEEAYKRGLATWK